MSSFDSEQAEMPISSSPDGDATTIKVEERNYVLTLLGRLVEHRVLLTVYLPDDPKSYTTTLLMVDPTANTLLLDEIFPLGGRPVIQAPCKLTIHARLAGSVLQATLSLQEVIEQDSLVFYRMHLPEAIDYGQRREGHRVQVAKLGVVVKIYRSDGMAEEAVLHDISPAGLSLAMADARTFLNTGSYRCTIYPPDDAPLNVRLEINGRRTDAVSAKTILGASFTELDKRSEHALTKLVTELERRLLRHRWEKPAPKRSE
jgi:c-di-GMP-binding flagellar brake protein YcgR